MRQAKDNCNSSHLGEQKTLANQAFLFLQKYSEQELCVIVTRIGVYCEASWFYGKYVTSAARNKICLSFLDWYRWDCI